MLTSAIATLSWCQRQLSKVKEPKFVIVQNMFVYSTIPAYCNLLNEY